MDDLLQKTIGVPSGFIISLLRLSAIVGFTAEVDLASSSVTCQFAMFIAPVERETITKHVWRDEVYRSWLDEWCYVPPDLRL